MLRGRFGEHLDDASGRPYLEGRLIFPRLNIRGDVSFLVDTGADASLLSTLDCRRLRIDPNRLEGNAESWGVGGVSHNFIEDCILVFSEPKVLLYAYRIRLDIAAPAPGLPDDMPSLLGRDILDHWRMTYSPVKRNLSFKVWEADYTIRL